MTAGEAIAAAIAALVGTVAVVGIGAALVDMFKRAGRRKGMEWKDGWRHRGR